MIFFIIVYPARREYYVIFSRNRYFLLLVPPTQYLEKIFQTVSALGNSNIVEWSSIGKSYVLFARHWYDRDGQSASQMWY